MASHIFLGRLIGEQTDAFKNHWHNPQRVEYGETTRDYLEPFDYDRAGVIIAKGNIIEGIEAKY